jgi:arginase
MNISLIAVPYDSGHHEYRMGRGPGVLLDSGLADRISAAGHSVSLVQVDGPDWPPAEVKTGFALCREVADGVRSAIAEGAFPIVLTGNCLMQVGVLAGIGSRSTGLVWFDAHGDLNTPETTSSGFLDGMALAVAAGWCWKNVVRGLPGFAPVSASRIALVGARDLDPPEHAFIAEHGIRHVTPEGAARDGWVSSVQECVDGCDSISVHLDLDVLDPSVCPVNALQAAGGLREDQVVELLDALMASGKVAALTVSAYDPEVDPDGETLEVVQRLLDSIIHRRSTIDD